MRRNVPRQIWNSWDVAVYAPKAEKAVTTRS